MAVPPGQSTEALAPDDVAAAFELSYKEAVRALSQQQAALDSFRTRAGVLISGASIATSFLGGLALRADASVWSWLAIGFFALVGVATLQILGTRKGWEGFEGFAARPTLLIGTYIEREGDSPPLPLWKVYRELALRMEEAYDRIEPAARRLNGYFRAASALLVLEIATWVVDLATGA